MDLRIALSIIGLILVLVVFAISRYSDRLEKYWHALRSKSPIKSLANLKREGKPVQKPYQSRWMRNADHAPRLGDSAEKNPSEDQIFEFESDSFKEQTPRGLTNKPEIDELEINEFQADVSDNQPDQHHPTEQEPEMEVETTPEPRPLPSLRDDQSSQPQKPVGPFTSLRQIDYWIKLSPASPVTQASILSKLTHWDKINFPVQLHALTQEDPHWVNLLETQADTTIVDVVASFQLLAGGNAADIVDLNTFDEQVTALGQTLKAEKLMMASPEQALDQSLKLARFFADSCEPLEVTICAPEGQAFMGKLVETSAKQQGLDFMDGDYVRQKRMASHNIILYRMLNIDSRGNSSRFDQDMSSSARIECVKFTMMPALSRTPGRDAKEMLDAVKAFASRVRGEIRIPGEPEYHQDLLLKLRNRISRLEKDTIAAGLEPGGQEIHRIFS